VSLLESFLLVESESESDEDFKPSAEIDKLPDKKAAKDVSFQTGSTYNDLILMNTLFKERNEILTVIDYYDNWILDCFYMFDCVMIKTMNVALKIPQI